MNDSALQWLTTRAAIPGALACGLRQPDGQCICHSLDETCAAATVENILAGFDGLARNEFADSPATYWSTWNFEQGLVRFVERPDGWRLVLIVRAEPEAAPALDALSHEFFSLLLDPA
jgi:hypothetical protein